MCVCVCVYIHVSKKKLGSFLQVNLNGMFQE